MAAGPIHRGVTYRSYAWRPGSWLFGFHRGMWFWLPRGDLYPGYGWSLAWLCFEISRVE